MAESLNLRRFWRMYVVLLTLLLIGAGIVHVIAGVSVGIAVLAVVVGFFANGIFILIGELKAAQRKDP
jgi:hypothetical protein